LQNSKRALAEATGNGIDGAHAASGFVSPPGADDIAHRFAIFVRYPGRQRRHHEAGGTATG
jgi:hypothetical protein